MDVTRLNKEGYRPVVETKPTGPVGKTAEFVRFISTRGRTKDKLEQAREFEATLKEVAIKDYEAERLDLDELERQPLFNMYGFDGHPPDEYRPGEEPGFAPLSKEQMRLLLLRVVPPAMVPFALDHFVFEYQPMPDDDNLTGGPIVKIPKNNEGKAQQVHIVFNRSHFFTKGWPTSYLHAPPAYDEGQPPSPILAKEMIGFVDPSKISVFLGKVIAKMIPRPADWDKTVDNKFWLTVDKHQQSGPKAGLVQQFARTMRERESSDQQKALRQKQWEDYVALAVTAPDLAQLRYPKAYEYYTQQVEEFGEHPEKDYQAMEHLADEANLTGGAIYIPEVTQMFDIRTDQEKAQAKGIRPEVAWYEKFFAGINRTTAALRQIPLLRKIPIISSIVNAKIVYDAPEDLTRAEQLAGDDKKVKELLALLDEKLMDEKDLDSEFGEKLAAAEDFDPKARTESRRYLLAASNSGNFAEWRIYAWLYKFSRTFRQWEGQDISEEDYKDLQMIYSQSEKVGNRVGTGVLPYEAVRIQTDEARHYGRRLYRYVRKERAAYVKEVEKKVRNKSLSALTSTSDKAFDQFKHDGGYFNFGDKFTVDPASWQVQDGNLQDFLGPQLAGKIGDFMGKLGVEKISPDARALAIAYYENYVTQGRQTDRYVNPKALEIISHYGAQLNESADDKIKELLSVPAKELAQSGNYDKIIGHREDLEAAEKYTIDSLGADLSQGRFTQLIPNEQVQLQILALLADKKLNAHGTLDARSLLEHLEPYFMAWYPLIGNNEEEKMRNATERDHKLAVLRRNIVRFLYDPSTVRKLTHLEKIRSELRDLLPPYAGNIEKASEELASWEVGRIKGTIIPASVSNELLEVYQKRGLELDQTDMQRIKEAGTKEDELEISKDADKGLVKEEPNLDVKADTEAKKTVRAEIVAEKLKKMEKERREQFISLTFAAAIDTLHDELFAPTELDQTLTPDVDPATEQEKKVLKTTTYQERFDKWYGSATDPANRPPDTLIFNLPSLQPVLADVGLAVLESNQLATQAKGINRLSHIMTETTRAVNYEVNRHKPAKKEAKPPAPLKAKDDDDHEEPKKAA